MFGIFFLLFTTLPILELVILFKVGGVIGGWNTIGFVLLSGFIGAYLAKREGKMILIKMQSQLHQGQLPSQEIMHAFLIFGGSLLLLTPGFVTDIFGLLLILPGSRHILVMFLKSYLNKMISTGGVKVFSKGFGSKMGGGGFYYHTQNWPPENRPVKNERDVLEAEVIQIDHTLKDS
jgi:UPF0716 protein FxsA